MFFKALKIDQVNNIQKTKIMASGPITSWQIDGETVRDFVLEGEKGNKVLDRDINHKLGKGTRF